MNAPRSLLVLALLGAAVSPAAPQPAQIDTIVLEPQLPRAGEPVHARVAVSGCIQLPGAAHVRAPTPRVRVELDLPDTCDAALVVPSRVYALGAYPAGPHAFDFYACSGSVPPGIEPCTLLRSIEVVVGGGVEPIPIPGPRGSVQLALVAGLALGAWLALRRR